VNRLAPGFDHSSPSPKPSSENIAKFKSNHNIALQTSLYNNERHLSNLSPYKNMGPQERLYPKLKARLHNRMRHNVSLHERFL
jgi:hypothetical protein